MKMLKELNQETVEVIRSALTVTFNQAVAETEKASSVEAVKKSARLEAKIKFAQRDFDNCVGM